MTNQQQEPLAPPPPLFYWTLHLETAAQRAKARDRGETRAVDEFVATVNKAADLIARKNPDRKARREGYRNKPPQDWAEQFLYFPQDCAEDWADWEKIAPEDQNLREEIVAQLEVLLFEAGVDLRDEDIHSSSAKMERYLANDDLRPALPPPTTPPQNSDSGEGGPVVPGPAYP